MRSQNEIHATEPQLCPKNEGQISVDITQLYESHLISAGFSRCPMFG
jgi:hypothetical protein